LTELVTWPSVFLAIALSLARGVAPAAAQPLTVSAASSVADVLVEAGKAWAAAGGAGVQVNAAGSNGLARQVAAGARVDVFLSADHAQMDVAQRSGRLAAPPQDLLSNALVLVVAPHDARKTLHPRDLAGPGVSRIALGNPDSVPAGVYARQWLERTGLWEAVRTKVVPTLSVRAALAAVRNGHADVGVVFATDATSAPDVPVAYTVPPADAPPIRYPVAVVKGARESDAARFVSFLFSAASREIFARAGFVVLGAQ
jgi:molybdate transport system substrate-binding protein